MVGLPVIDSLVPLLMQIPEEILSMKGQGLSFLTELLGAPLDILGADGLLGLGLVPFVAEVFNSMMGGKLAAISSLTQIPIQDLIDPGAGILNVPESLAAGSVQRIMQLVPVAGKARVGPESKTEQKPESMLRGEASN